MKPVLHRNTKNRGIGESQEVLGTEVALVCMAWLSRRCHGGLNKTQALSLAWALSPRLAPGKRAFFCRFFALNQALFLALNAFKKFMNNRWCVASKMLDAFLEVADNSFCCGAQKRVSASFRRNLSHLSKIPFFKKRIHFGEPHVCNP
ncbi:hypothetical protein [Massilia sp. ZL223]|uniref:hypothetical protein n=1 Tax=Massilia sp. ZL223 TaxID=2824904 RepID=UPI001B81D585|nr:hypothetical protein [Massilia sp. ZL223]MBQ5939700.1 hypothetical protein [Massilia sp. AB1]